VPIGDYVAGPSHVLPTGGTARFFSVVGVEDFQRRISLIDLGAAAFGRIAPSAVRLARLEGLDAHARALEIRLDGKR
jgi:histidinol dehydrogenase